SFYILTRCTVGRWWGRRFRLPTRAGPGPALRGAHQSGRNRVVFYIVYGPLDLTRTTEVTIETLVLPKRLPGSSQDSWQAKPPAPPNKCLYHLGILTKM